MIGDEDLSLANISDVILGGNSGGDSGDGSNGVDERGYCSPNSEKYQSGMSVDDKSPTDMTGFRNTAAEKNEGNLPITAWNVRILEGKINNVETLTMSGKEASVAPSHD